MGCGRPIEPVLTRRRVALLLCTRRERERRLWGRSSTVDTNHRIGPILIYLLPSYFAAQTQYKTFQGFFPPLLARSESHDYQARCRGLLEAWQRTVANFTAVGGKKVDAITRFTRLLRPLSAVIQQRSDMSASEFGSLCRAANWPFPFPLVTADGAHRFRGWG